MRILRISHEFIDGIKAMAFIYHAVPKSIVGEYLLPLSEQSQSLKAKSLGKYEDRTDIFSKQVLPLNCFWPDVIHFSPVEPQKIKAALTPRPRLERMSLTARMQPVPQCAVASFGNRQV